MCDHQNDSLYSIIPQRNKNNSGSSTASVNVWPQVGTGDLPLCDGLDRRPIFGVDQSLASEPLRNGLLADRRTIHESSNTLSQGGLAARNLDGAPERDNVVFLHDHRDYTTKVVQVNNLECVPVNNDACTVLSMGTTARKRIATPKPQDKEAMRDAKGRTLGDRIRIGIEFKTRMLGRHYTAKELLKDASAALGRGANDAPIVSQQALSKIMTNKSSYSEATPAFAQVLGLNSLWLAYGVGPRCIADTIQ